MQTNFNVSSVKGGNTGSCGNLTNYLDKELENGWFDAKEQDIKTEKVKNEIDRYGKGQLKATDWKFIEVEYCPSQKEQQTIIAKATGKKDIDNWNQLNKIEKAQVKQEFASYVRDCQDLQAKNYNRDNIKSGADLKYYAKIETQRKYKGTDEAVKNGTAKQGDLKAGLHLHAHIVQSRKAENKKTKISPLSNSKGVSKKNPIKQGFHRDDFYKKVEARFDEKFNHKRDLKETYEWQTANKYNRREEKQALEKRANQKEKRIFKPTEQSRAVPEPQPNISDEIEKYKNCESEYKEKRADYNAMIDSKVKSITEGTKDDNSFNSADLVAIENEYKRINQEYLKDISEKKEKLEKLNQEPQKEASFLSSSRKKAEIKAFNQDLEFKKHSLKEDIKNSLNSSLSVGKIRLRGFAEKIKKEKDTTLRNEMKTKQKSIQEQGQSKGFDVVGEIKNREIIKQSEEREQKRERSRSRGGRNM